MTANTPEPPRDDADGAPGDAAAAASQSTPPASQSTPTAPTEPLGSGATLPRPFVPEQPAGAPAPGAPGFPAAQPTVGVTAAAPVAARSPWYRRGWVLGVGAAVLALLAFTSGFVAGTATNIVGTVASHTAFGDHDGDGDGFGRPGPGAFPGQGQPGGPGGLDDGDRDSDGSGQTEDGTAN